jgi:hypothetical protein
MSDARCGALFRARRARSRRRPAQSRLLTAISGMGGIYSRRPEIAARSIPGALAKPCPLLGHQRRILLGLRGLAGPFDASGCPSCRHAELRHRRPHLAFLVSRLEGDLRGSGRRSWPQSRKAPTARAHLAQKSKIASWRCGDPSRQEVATRRYYLIDCLLPSAVPRSPPSCASVRSRGSRSGLRSQAQAATRAEIPSLRNVGIATAGSRRELAERRGSFGFGIMKISSICWHRANSARLLGRCASQT